MSDIIIDPSRTCCFTGHRPEYLPLDYTDLKIQLDAAVRQAIDDGYDTFLNGMAKGFDMLAGETVLRLKQQGFPIRFIGAVPYKGFGERSRDEWRVYSKMLYEQADAIEIICPKSHPGCYQIRNEWMVNRSSRVIAFWLGRTGGTKNTVSYAMKKGLSVINLCVPDKKVQI